MSVKRRKNHSRRLKESRYKKNGSDNCKICGDKFLKYHKNSEICNNSDCKYENNKVKYQDLKKTDYVKYKAYTLGSTVRLGKGKTEILENMLIKALKKPCKYCKECFDINQASLDHKTPRTGSKVYDRKTKKQIYTDEEIRLLDSEENLQIICRDCNQNKGDMDDRQFKIFYRFLNRNKDIKEKLLKRLKFTRVFWGRK